MFFGVFSNKKRRPKPPFLSKKSQTYFTMNFMVLSKPLAFTVTK